jgi:hypothetical protein
MVDFELACPRGRDWPSWAVHAAAARSSATRKVVGADPAPRQARHPWVREFGVNHPANGQALPGATRLVDLYASRGMHPKSTETSERNS